MSSHIISYRNGKHHRLIITLFTLLSISSSAYSNF